MAAKVQPGQCPEAITDADAQVQVDLMTSPPYNWICHLEIKHGDSAEPVLGSGFKINLPDMKYTVVVTAGHCVYDKELGGYAHEIIVRSPGHPEPVTVTKQYDAFFAAPKYISRQDPEYDYGFILLPGNSNEGFGWSTEVTNAELNNDSVTVCGYPKDKTSGPGSMWITKGEIIKVTDRQVCYKNRRVLAQDTSYGSPIYIWYKGSWMVVAVHTGADHETSQNFGVRMEFQMISRFVRKAGIIKLLKSVRFPNVYIRCDREKINAQYDKGNHQKFFIYPVKMLHSLDATTKPLVVVIESVQNEGLFICLDGQNMDGHKRLGGGSVRAQNQPRKFYLKNEGGADVYSIVSVDFPHCRIRLDGHIFVRIKIPGGSGTVNCQYYKDVEEAVLPSGYERFQIICAERAC